MLYADNLFSGNTGTLYWYLKDINSAVTSVGISLLTLFFMINLVKLLTQEGVERVSWERIVLRACVFFLLVGIINNSTEWFRTIADIVQDSILNPVAEALDMGFVSRNDDDGTWIVSLTGDDEASLGVADLLINVAEQQGTIEKYLYYIIFVILAIPYMATIIMIFAQVFVRVVKMLLYVVFSPIPIAMAAEGETYRGKAISYLMSFAGVCFETVIIYIGTYVYELGMAKLALQTNSLGAIGTVVTILFLNGLFTAMIQLSSALSSQFFGRG